MIIAIKETYLKIQPQFNGRAKKILPIKFDSILFKKRGSEIIMKILNEFYFMQTAYSLNRLKHLNIYKNKKSETRF